MLAGVLAKSIIIPFYAKPGSFRAQYGSYVTDRTQRGGVRNALACMEARRRWRREGHEVFNREISIFEHVSKSKLVDREQIILTDEEQAAVKFGFR